MRLPADKAKTVVFIVDEGVPRATGFLTGVQEGNVLVPYIVTARHCVEGTAGREFYIRINVEDHYDDIPTKADDWFSHPSADVAVIPFAGGPSPHYDLTLVGPPSGFINADYELPVEAIQMPEGTLRIVGEPGEEGGVQSVDSIPVAVGHEVCFFGLLYQQPGQARNLPVARFGHVARLPEEPIIIPRTGGTNVPIAAYLVECQSWGGHSGSPCYWLHPYLQLVEVSDPRAGKEGETMLIPHEVQHTALMGLVSGHWDISQKAQTVGDGDVRMALNSGMAIVTPANAIEELLMNDEDVVKDRRQRAAAMRAVENPQRPMTLDTAQGDTATEFERFEDLARKLAQTPKPENDKD